MGVLIVASAGNETGPVDAPGNCAGVLAVAGLRNVGTKVGYSSFGAEVSVAAPAGNCVNSSGPCLKSINTTSNTGLTVPADSTYTTETVQPSIGTSFSAPMVAGIAALMRSVNANLTPAQLISRIQTSSVAFPQPTGVPVCPASQTDPTTGQASGICACPNDGSQCGAGMVNALNAVNSALRPIAAVVLPATSANGTSVVLDAGGSAASCGLAVASFAWTATGATIQSGTAGSSKVTITPTGTAGKVVLTVTDTAGHTDTATITVSASGALTKPSLTPTTAGTTASACPLALTVAPIAPVLTESFAPASVGLSVATTLTIQLSNSNAFDLTQASLTENLPTNLVMASSTTSATEKLAPATTCSGGGSSLTSTATSVTLTNAVIPAKASCVITVPLQSASAGSYTNTLAANALVTGPAGANTQAASAVLTVTAPAKGGGGELDWWDTLFAVGVLLAGRRHVKRGPSR
jgi:serine protease